MAKISSKEVSLKIKASANVRINSDASNMSRYWAGSFLKNQDINLANVAYGKGIWPSI